jgi:hypothetical protein
VQVFRIVVGKDAARGGSPLALRGAMHAPHEAVGRASLSEQLRGARGAGSERLAALSDSARAAAARQA